MVRIVICVIAWTIAFVPAAPAQFRKFHPKLAGRPGFTPEDYTEVMAFSPDGTILAVGGASTKLLDSSSGKNLATWDEPSSALAFTKDGKRLVSLGRALIYRDVASGQAIREVAVTGASLAADDRGVVVAVGDQGSVSVGKPDNLRQLFQATAPFPGSLSISPCGRRVAAASLSSAGGPTHVEVSHTAMLRVWDVQTGKLLRELDGSQGYIFLTAFSPDGRWVAATTHDGCIAIWEIASGQKVLDDREIRMPVRYIKHAAFVDCRTLVTAQTFIGENWEAYWWDIDTRVPLGKIVGPNAKFEWFAFGARGRCLGSATPNVGVQVWKGIEPAPRPPALRLSSDDLPKVWANLAGSSAANAFHAFWTLVDARDVVPFIAQRVQPVVWKGDRHFRKLIADLADDSFNVRDRATRELLNSPDAEHLLVKALDDKLTLEVKRRVELVLRQLGKRVPPPVQVRDLRAVGVLEHIGTSEARALLQRLAGGFPASVVTQEAASALAR